jgi:hypothetical protein
MVANFEHPKLGTLFYIYSYVADTKAKKLITDARRNEVQVVKGNKMSFLNRPTCASIALDEQSNMNCDSKLVCLYKDHNLML